MTAFNWLHFTDLHKGMSSQTRWWSDWEHKLFEDLSGMHPRTGPWDAVLFTGDLTERGMREHFNQIDEFLAKLWHKFDDLQPGHPVALLAIPGNHDLQRPDPEKNPADKDFEAELELLAEWPETRRQKFRERFWNEPSSRSRAIVQRAFVEYHEWWNRRVVATPPFLEVRTGLLPGDFAATFEKDGAKVGILGLNTAFLQLAHGDYRKRLALDYRQFDGACGKSGPEWAGEHHLCLLLTHHPPDWLCQEAHSDLGRIIHGRFAMHLYGHMHETAYSTLSVGGGGSERSWQGLSLFGEETWEGGSVERRFGYAIGNISLKERAGELRLWPRKASRPQGGRWGFVPDHDSCHLDAAHHNATSAETLRLHREVMTKVATSTVAAGLVLVPEAAPAASATAEEGAGSGLGLMPSKAAELAQRLIAQPGFWSHVRGHCTEEHLVRLCRRASVELIRRWCAVTESLPSDRGARRALAVALWGEAMQLNLVPALPALDRRVDLKGLTRFCVEKKAFWVCLPRDRPRRLSPRLWTHEVSFGWKTYAWDPAHAVAGPLFELIWDMLYTEDENEMTVEKPYLRWWSAGSALDEEPSGIFPWPFVDLPRFSQYELMADLWNQEAYAPATKIYNIIPHEDTTADDLAYWFTEYIHLLWHKKGFTPRWQTGVRASSWTGSIGHLVEDATRPSAHDNPYIEWARALPLLAAPESGLSFSAAAAILAGAKLDADKRKALQNLRLRRAYESLPDRDPKETLGAIDATHVDHPWNQHVEKPLRAP